MARPSILEAVDRRRQNKNPSIEQAEPSPQLPSATASATREGKINVSAYFPPEVKSSLRLVQAKRGGKMQDLLAEALNLLFAKYNVPEAAPVESKDN